MALRQKRKRWLFTLLGVGAVFAGCLVISRGEDEPSYEGRPLSQWLVLISRTSAAQDEDRPAVHEAIQAMGPDSIPWLLRWIPNQWQRSRARDLTRQVISILPDRLFESESPFSLNGWTCYWDCAIAERVPEAFSVLGPLAESAIPELERLRDNHPNPDVSWAATLALAGVTTNGIPALVAIIKDPFDPRWQEVVWAFETFPFLRTNAALVIPHLVTLLEMEDSGIQPEVAHLLDSLESTQKPDGDSSPRQSDARIRFDHRGVE